MSKRYDLRRPVTEAVYERMADYRVMRRLDRDPRYRNAASPEAQSAAEEAIEREVFAELDELYRVS
jgi:hypothetical protein